MYLLFVKSILILILSIQAINTDPAPHSRSRGQGARGAIETSISHPDQLRPDFAKAEVRILVPSAPVAANVQQEWVIRASSILEDFDEELWDTIRKGHAQRLRHQHHRELEQSTPRNSPLPEAQLDEPLPTTVRERDEPRPVPVRALENQPGQLKQGPRRKIPKGKLRKNFGNDTWIALHSPKRKMIPVRFNEDNSIPLYDAKCLKCSSVAITVPGGETEVAVPAPDINICSRLASTRGRLNIAVVNGPRPGDQVTVGDYPTEIIVWKKGGSIYTCSYTFTVAVKQCEKISPPERGSVDCSNKNFWGSKCKFSCFSGYVLQGTHTVFCGDNSTHAFWSSPFPTCKSVIPESISPLKRLPCSKPSQPKDGTVICESNSSYPDGSVCQFYCLPGYLIENLLSQSSLVVCKNGHWAPHGNVSCLDTYCSEPVSPVHGSMVCNSKMKDASTKSKYKNGTICSVQCNSGYIIPKSLSHLSKVVCSAPSWNDSSIPECKQMASPYPHPSECRNQTVMANRKGFLKLKPVHFFLRETPSKLVLGNCALSGKVRVGSYINNCTVHDVELNTTGYCTYSITVKENGCSPLPKVAQASLECEGGIKESYPRSTICKYVCDEGYIIPKNEETYQHKVCRPRLKWRPANIPSCKRAIPPKPKKKACIPETIFLDDNSSTTLIRPPRFRPSVRGSKIKVQCSLNAPLSEGNYTNVCEARDVYLGLQSSCEYNVTILKRGCSALPPLSYGFINCSTSPIFGYFPVGTICNYSCEDGNVIPTSLLLFSYKKCIGPQWNNTLTPHCVYQKGPLPESDSCLNRSVTTESLADVQISFPVFSSSSGAKLTSNCKPKIIDTFGIHGINCSAYDPELRVSGNYIFHLDVQNSNTIAEQSGRVEKPTLISGCEDFSMIAFDLSFIPVPNPKFQTLKDVSVPVSCSPETVANYGTHEITCFTDEYESICKFNFSVIPIESTTEYSSTRESLTFSTTLSTTTSSQPTVSVTHSTSTVPSAQTAIPTIPTTLTESTFEITSTEVVTTTTQAVHMSSTETADLVTSSTEASVIRTSLDTTQSITSTEASADESVKVCESLKPPHHGFIDCSTSSAQNCSVGCDQGYSFPPDYKTLIKGWIECNSTDGLWDFQIPDGILDLPMCLGELPNTYFRVWMGFSFTGENCDTSKESELKSLLLPLVTSKYQELCKTIDCEIFQVNCSDIFGDLEIHVNWTLQALFDPVEYSNTSGVPKLVSNMETISDFVKNFTEGKVDDSLKELYDKLLNNGFKVGNKLFKRGYFHLYCGKEGYSANVNTNKCVECPPNTFEQNGICESCPIGTYQHESGKSFCLKCPNVWDIGIDFNQNLLDGCSVECPPNTFEQNGICESCPIGTYQHESGKSFCLKCPNVWDIGIDFNQNLLDGCSDEKPSAPSHLIRLTPA